MTRPYHRFQKCLNDRDRAAIVRLYTQELMTQADLAKRFCVRAERIRKVIQESGVAKPNRRMDLT